MSHFKFVNQRKPMNKPLSQLLQERTISGSRADKVLASYMLGQMGALPFETAASLATKVGLSEPTVGRFCRSIGFKSFGDLKLCLRGDLGDRPWLISDRLKEFQQRSLNGSDQLARSLQLEIGGLTAVYETAQSEAWKRAVTHLARASEVFVVGFQTERGLAQYFANQLQYLRDGVHLVDQSAGNFADVLAASKVSPNLVIFEARRYSRLAKLLATEARAAGVRTTLITDAYCHWGHGLVDDMFVVSTEFNLFWDSTAHMAILVNLLVNAVFIELGATVEERLNKISSMYSRFTGLVGDGSGPVE